MSQAQARAKAASARKTVAAARRRFISAMRRSDVAGLAACYDEKAIVVPQFSGVRRGRASIERLFRSWLSSSKVREFVVETEDLRILADVAVTLGTYRMIVDRAGNRPVSDQGQYLIVYERKSDGSWLISRDMSSSSRR